MHATKNTRVSSSRSRSRRSLLRPLSATAYRDLGPHAHHPTGSPVQEARTPIGVLLPRAMDSKRCWFVPVNQPTVNWLRVVQKAVHQQRRVFLLPPNSVARSGRSSGPTGRATRAAEFTLRRVRGCVPTARVRTLRDRESRPRECVGDTGRPGQSGPRGKTYVLPHLEPSPTASKKIVPRHIFTLSPFWDEVVSARPPQGFLWEPIAALLDLTLEGSLL